ncbi:PTS glucitol/sorbitol transporter subunit IIA [Thermogemmatispora sp.]|uniref:PTS glucitol/sorbitol transporter subunit IIA n=1 Tax=Thermogemmatispora sp. TaxID=1968838 RepID=UPI001D4DF789|nr:PTS glucitol/sorbitol transporter subunit IIA [Thermogemmatispora sp.]MBX5451631.1 PTS glucitol/sorbitol transporter subunit IIA [Thermogemmatispora sp.]
MSMLRFDHCAGAGVTGAGPGMGAGTRGLLKYRAVIQEIGAQVPEFLPHGILIFFGPQAPAELREVSLVHTGATLQGAIEVGDWLCFREPPGEGDSADRETGRVLSYRVTAVGEVASANLAELGHLVVHFDGAAEAALPGTISVTPALLYLPPVGTILELLRLEDCHTYESGCGT